VQRETASAVGAMQSGSAEVEQGVQLAEARSDVLARSRGLCRAPSRRSRIIASVGALSSVVGAMDVIGGLAEATRSAAPRRSVVATPAEGSIPALAPSQGHEVAGHEPFRRAPAASGR